MPVGVVIPDSKEEQDPWESLFHELLRELQKRKKLEHRLNELEARIALLENKA